jgi:hypothetical protein
VEKDPYLLRLLLFSALEHHRLAETFVDNHVLRIHYFLRDYIKQRVTDGDFQALDPLWLPVVSWGWSATISWPRRYSG